MKRKGLCVVLALLAAVILFCGVGWPALAAENQLSTKFYLVSLARITRVTDDFVIPVGNDTQLSAEAAGSNLTWTWQVSRDNGRTYGNAVGTGSTLPLYNMQKNTPSNIPYYYKVTVRDSYGATDSRTVRVLVIDCVTFDVAVSSSTGGTAAPAGRTTVPYGGDLYVYFIPNSGYHIGFVTVDGRNVGQIREYHLTDITEAHQIYVNFEKDSGEEEFISGQHDLSTSSAPAKTSSVPSVSPLSNNPPPGTVSSSREKGILMLPAPTTGWRKNGHLNAGKMPPSGENTASPKDGQQKPAANEATKTDFFSIDVEQPSDGTGTISPGGRLAIPRGGNETFYFYPEQGYALDKVLVDGKEVSAPYSKYTLKNIQKNVGITARFKPLDHAIRANRRVRCTCWFCMVWRFFIPGLTCICPWCWIIPLIVLIVIILLILRKTAKDKAKRKKEEDPNAPK